MGCACLTVLAAWLSPRFALVLTQLFTDKLSFAMPNFWVGFAGFLFLPWTALVYAWCYAPISGVSGFGWFLVIFAFVVDIASYGSGAREQRRRQATV